MLRSAREEDRERFRALIGEPDLALQEVLLNGWALNQEIYATAGTAARFVTYPGAGHYYTDQIIADLQTFFRQHLLPLTGYPSLGGGYTLSGATASAQFYGGIISNGGGSLGDRFSPSAGIQVLMTIGPDFDDVDWPGTIYVIGAVNGSWFCRHENGGWPPWSGPPDGLVKTYRREKLLALEPAEVDAFLLRGREGVSF